MICHTERQTRLYERGYPYLTELVDGHKDDKKPAESAAKVFLRGMYFGAYHVKWPRLTATAFARGNDSTAPIDAAEADAIVTSMLESRARGTFYATYHRLFALEALTSTDVVLGLDRACARALAH